MTSSSAPLPGRTSLSSIPVFSIPSRPTPPRRDFATTRRTSPWSRSIAPTTPCLPRRWQSCGLERTPASFVFDLKAFRLFTQHQTPPRVLPKDIQEALGPLAEKKNVYYADFPPELTDEMWRRFRLALEPLRHAGKLGAVLFQFPPWFYYRRSNLAHIAHCAQVLDGYQIAVEFRNRTWFDDKHRDEVMAFEREHGLTHVVVDEPQGFSSSIPAVWEVTAPKLAIFRLHGRNAETWDKKGLATSSERFDYEYQEHELREFVQPVRRLAEQAEHVHVVFNNNLRDQGIRGARLFSGLLSFDGSRW